MKRVARWILSIRTSRMLAVSAVLTLLALALMVWSMAVPTPLPVMLAMTVGQLFGTVAFSLYGIVVAIDLFQRRRGAGAEAKSEAPPPGAAS